MRKIVMLSAAQAAQKCDWGCYDPAAELSAAQAAQKYGLLSYWGI